MWPGLPAVAQSNSEKPLPLTLHMHFSGDLELGQWSLRWKIHESGRAAPLETIKAEPISSIFSCVSKACHKPKTTLFCTSDKYIGLQCLQIFTLYILGGHNKAHIFPRGCFLTHLQDERDPFPVERFSCLENRSQVSVKAPWQNGTLGNKWKTLETTSHFEPQTDLEFVTVILRNPSQNASPGSIQSSQQNKS